MRGVPPSSHHQPAPKPLDYSFKEAKHSFAKFVTAIFFSFSQERDDLKANVRVIATSQLPSVMMDTRNFFLPSGTATVCCLALVHLEGRGAVLGTPCRAV